VLAADAAVYGRLLRARRRRICLIYDAKHGTGSSVLLRSRNKERPLKDSVNIQSIDTVALIAKKAVRSKPLKLKLLL